MSISITGGVPLMTGWATKRGGMRTTWRRRYFILKDNATLSYFKDSVDTESSKAKGVIRLLGSGVAIQTNAEIEPILWPKDCAENTRIAIVTPDRTFFIYTDNGADCQKWVAALKDASGKHPALRHGQNGAMSTSRRSTQFTAREHQRMLQQQLQELLRTPSNNKCAECRAPSPTWASWNIGVFICITCTSAHRSLGPDVSKLKSLKLDEWTNDQVKRLIAGGNAKVNGVYEATLPDSYTRPKDLDSIVSFVHDKYEARKWMLAEQEVRSSTPLEDSEFDEADNRVHASLQAEAAAVHASSDPMADHDWF
eukprot:TRINITY_DN9000_c0_g1_i4.p2 TRINITY_DN9000_c0_g1~~TRINITY_DN9000_c0_g1_i4.p2  ORF type:complete len:310 (+),score=48.04 TRINITY_DN9000_c0_g1_i4:1537-2466(+)